MRAPLMLSLALLTTASCGTNQAEAPEVLSALADTVAALEASDFEALWAMTDAETQTMLLGLAGRIHDGLQRVPEVYGELGEAQVAAARNALGEPIVDAVFPDDERAGPMLLSRLLRPTEMRFDSHAKDGLNNNSVTVDTTSQPHRAVVHTSAGETFGFVKTDAGWRSLLVRDVILASGTIRALADNLTKVEQAATARVERWRQSRDPRTPHGAYNLAREAQGQSPPNAALLFSLLDESARRVVLAKLEASRGAQRELQRRTTRRQRKKAYEDAGLTLHVAAKSDLDLYTAWSRTDDWRPPLETTDDPAAVKLEPSGERAVVVTVSGGEVPFVKESEGLWRLADQADRLERALGPAADEP